jgi:hypothetical protein
METGIIKSGKIYKKVYKDPATGTESTDRKAKVRYKIQNEVVPGEQYDIFDIIADLSKRLNMIERGMMVLLKDMKDNDTLPEILEAKYGGMIDNYITAITDGTYKARTDLAADNDATFTKLLARDAKVTQILAECGYDENE